MESNALDKILYRLWKITDNISLYYEVGKLYDIYKLSILDQLSGTFIYCIYQGVHIIHELKNTDQKNLIVLVKEFLDCDLIYYKHTNIKPCLLDIMILCKNKDILDLIIKHLYGFIDYMFFGF